MDATLNEEQQHMQDTLRDFLESEGGVELANRVMQGDDVVDDLWTELGNMDYTALTVPVEYGGLGEGFTYLSAILEVAGRYAMPGPFPETVAAVVPLVAQLGSTEQCERILPAIACGDLKATIALHDDRNASLPASIQMEAIREDDGFRLNGQKTLVPYANSVDRVVVATRSQQDSGYNGISLFVVDPTQEDIDVRQLDSLDRTRPVYKLDFNEISVDEDSLLGPFHGGGSSLKQSVDKFTLASTAMLVGGADRAVEQSAEYGNTRKQYGQPIGRFQAVKHRIVNMWMDMQGARSMIYYASWALDTDQSDATAAVAATKRFAADRLHEVFGRDIWNHGGNGFTWDYDGHIYLKQAKAWRNLFGSPEEYTDQLLESRFDVSVS